MKLPFALFLLLSIALTAQDAPLVILGPVRTADHALPVAAAVVVRNGKIASLERAAAEAAAREPGATVLRVPHGGIAMPGIVEAHAHLLSLGRSQRELDLSSASSLEEALALIRARAATLPPEAPLLGRGWNQELWPERVFPTRQALDAAAPERLVLLARVDGHAYWVSSSVLRAAGINARTVCPSGGEIVVDAAREPTGVLVDNAMALIGRIGESSPIDTATDYLAAEKLCLRNGITTLTDAGISSAALAELQALYAKGRARLRVRAMLSVDNRTMLEEVLRSQPAAALHGDHLSVRMVKLYADGALGSRGAWLLKPYADRPDHSGFPVLDPVFLRDAARRLMAAGWQVCVHCIGDRAVQETLNALEAALSTLPPDSARTARPRIEHAQHIDPADVPRFAKLGVLPSMQPCHAISDGPWVPARLGAERARAGAYIWRALLDAGCTIPCGTDAPIEVLSPWRNFSAAVTRRMADGQAFFPEQCMTRKEAFLGLTLWAASAAFAERSTGMLRPGHCGDVIILDRDPLVCAIDQIETTKVLHTIIDGVVVYSAQ